MPFWKNMRRTLSGLFMGSLVAAGASAQEYSDPYTPVPGGYATSQVPVQAYESGSMPAQSPVWRSLFTPRADTRDLTFGAQYLFFTRNADMHAQGPVINGPDAGNLGLRGTDFGYQSGYRLQLGVQDRFQRIEVIFSNYGAWDWTRNGQLTQGLVFDDGLGASWPAGANSIAANTYFSSLSAAATPAVGGEADEHEGLGPNTAFAADTLPRYSNYYNSMIQDLQVNWLSNDACSDINVGIGYRNLQLDEAAGVSISGTFRATDVGGPNGGLSDASLTGAGGLTFIGGTPNGFEDESALGNGGVADQLTLSQIATARNDLNGLQFVSVARLLQTERYGLNGILRAGVFHNRARGRVSERYIGVGDDVSIYGRDFQDTKDSVAFTGTVGLQNSWALTDRLRFTSGYEVLFINGVALAPNQAAAVRGGTYQVDTNGNMIAHGGNVGLEFTY